MLQTLALVVSFLLAGTWLVEPAAGEVVGVRGDGVIGADRSEVGVDSAAAADVTVTEVPVVVEAPATGPAAQAPGAADAVEPLVADQVLVDGRVITEVLETEGFQTLGVTWPADDPAAGIDLEVRTRDASGQWSNWHPLEAADDGPDPGTPDAASARSGTDSLWVGEADAVQLSVAADAQAPDDLSLTLVDVPADSAKRAADAVATDGAAVTAALYAPTAADAGLAPTIISRAEWGARPQVCTPDVASGLVGAVVHHTAGSNDYTTIAQAMQQIRGDQAYHIDGRGWCDIGYNFVVDKWGNIYEGRADSLTQPVIGVHAGGFNTRTVGVSMLGTYDAAPPAATLESVARIIGYRLGAYGANPNGMMTYTTLGGENSRHPAGTTLTMPVLIGHRDVAYTACPGNGGYSALPSIRERARAIAFAQPLVRALYHDMLQRGVDPAGMSTWSDALLAGVPASALGDRIAASKEYVERRVADAYQEILGRGPDPTGLRTWTDDIMSGRLRVEDLRGALIRSDEYFARAGGTLSQYVVRLYQDILHRDPSPAEVSAWTAEVQSYGRAVAPNGVWRSAESARLRVGEAFLTYLDRKADPTGLSTWGPYWQQRGEDALRAAIIGSDEYLSRAASQFS